MVMDAVLTVFQKIVVTMSSMLVSNVMMEITTIMMHAQMNVKLQFVGME
jgi:hypothetical protein